MKLHYFHQATPDEDDTVLAEAKQWGLVPATCLLGGIALNPALVLKRDPCRGCNGPRDRCHGRPFESIAEEASSLDEQRLKAMFLGVDPDDPITNLLNKH